MNKKIWFLEFPTFMYKEDVKALARKADVKIVDAKYKKDYPAEMIAEQVPKVTKLKEVPASI